MSDSTNIFGRDFDIEGDDLGVEQPAEQPERVPFKAGYELEADAPRILRGKLVPDAGGVATVTFGGVPVNGVWVEANSGSRLSLYAEVDGLDGSVQTVARVAVVPTGKRVPTGAVRLGGNGRGRHAYLLSTETVARPVADGTDTDTSASDATDTGASDA